MPQYKQPIDWRLYTFTLDELPFLKAKESTDTGTLTLRGPSHDESTSVSRDC